MGRCADPGNANRRVWSRQWARQRSPSISALTRTGDIGTAMFEIRHEGLDQQPAACPG